MGLSELPILNTARCTGCGDCVPVCPTDCLEMSHGLPWLPRPRDCIACAVCEVVCPVEAIQVGSSRPAVSPPR